MKEIFENLSLENVKGEEWKCVVGYEDLYEISNKGRVKRVSALGGKKIKEKVTQYPIRKKILKPYIRKDGYLSVALTSKPYTAKTFLIHRLVGESFLSKEDGKNVINHKNMIKSDNRVENLEWCDTLYNNRYARKHTVFKMYKNFKHNEKDIQDILDCFSDGISPTDIAIKYKTKRDNIWSILRGDTYSRYSGIVKNKKNNLNLNKSHNSKLTPEKVLEIRKKFEFINNKDLAIEYGVSRVTIQRIKNRKIWKNI